MYALCQLCRHVRVLAEHNAQIEFLLVPAVQPHETAVMALDAAGTRVTVHDHSARHDLVRKH